MANESRLKEIYALIEGVENLETKTFTNRVTAKGFILSKVKSGNGYKNITGSIFRLMGDVQFTPHLQIVGDFAAVLTVSYFQDIPRGIMREENTLIIFEEERG